MKTFRRAALWMLSSLLIEPVVSAPPVDGAKLWLSADQGVVADAEGRVERWEDLSGNGNHFEQGVAEKRPVLKSGAFAGENFLLAQHRRYQNGNATYSGTLGMDFLVEDEVVVTELGAFDHGRDGFSGTITVQLRMRNENGTPFTPEDDTAGAILEQLTFTPGEPGDLEGPYRFKALAEARTLPPGSYTVLAWGYTSDHYYSAQGVALEPVGSGVRWAGSTRYGAGVGAWPTNLNGASQYSGALNVRFRTIGAVVPARPAVDFDGVDDGLHGVASMNFGRPSTVFVAFRGESTSTGHVIRNSSSAAWWIRNDGFYSQGWVRNAEFQWGVPQIAAMANGLGGTRAWQGFSEVTGNGSLSSAVPGRLALGGGSGYDANPYEVKIGEVLVYDRELTDSEIWMTQAYLAARYGAAELTAQTPAIRPVGDLGTGDVNVTLESGMPGAEIRFTTDGSEPTMASALYNAPFSVARGTEVKARAFIAGYVASGIAAQYYGNSAAAEVPVDGLQMWLRSDRGLETDADGGVKVWQDLTGNGNDMVQNIAWQRPQVIEGFDQGGGVAIGSIHGNVGSSTHSGTLGTDFVVDEPVVVSELGAFDHLGDGFAGSVTVQIRLRDPAGTTASPADDLGGAVVAEVEFTAAEPGRLEGATRFKAVGPVTLQPGSYTLLAWGFTGGNYYRNSSDAFALEDGIRFTGSSRYIGTNGAWPTTIDNHVLKYNGAGNFRYHKTGGTETRRTAVRFDGDDDGLWARATSFIARPSTVYLVFKRYDAGIILQNSSGGSWYVRDSGVYADGWVRNEDFKIGGTQMLGISNSGSRTRAFLNGREWTFNSEVGTVAPGRLALGGATGLSNQPVMAEVAEVLAFDRELSAEERWRVEAYLTERYTNGAAVLPDVVISPETGVGHGSVAVTMTNIAEGAEIRYTLDGSEPTAASPQFDTELRVPRGTRVRARAFANGAISSTITEAFYGQAGVDDLPVTGAKMWLSANHGLDRDGEGGVVRWQDLSGNGNDLVQFSPTQRPRVRSDGFGLNGETAIRVSDAPGNSNYAGVLGEDFVVDERLVITHLGAFDHLHDGFSGTITVQVWSRDDKGTPLTQTDDEAGSLLAERTFTSAEPGVADGAMRWKELTEPLTLEPGAYTVMAWGYNGQNRYYEGDRGAFSRDSRFRFVGLSRFHASVGVWPTSLDNAGLDYNGAANFKVALPAGAGSGGAAVVFDGSNDALRGVDGMNFGRPSTVLIAFRRDRNESGYVLQGASANWWIRNDGFYSNGWVLNEGFSVHRPYVAAMISGTGETRAFLDGREVTANAGLAAPTPGRLVMGGANGYQNDAIPVSVAELVVFDRALSAEEMWEMQSYLAARHAVYQPTVAAPTLSPQPDFGTGDVEVTLATLTAGAEIRYTLDGSEPTLASSLYDGAFVIPRGTTVRTRAFRADGIPSRIVDGYYGAGDAHPLPVTDVAMWLRADRGVEAEADGSVIRWSDLSGNGRDVIATRSEKAPRLVEGAFAAAVQPVVRVPSGASGSTTYTGVVGTDFVVESPVEVTHLGAFDHLGDGFFGTITVRLHAVDDKDTPVATDDASAGVLATAVFTNAEPGVLDGGCRYLELETPVTLSAGRYLIESRGWTGGDLYNNSAANWDPTMGQGLSYPGVSRYHANAESLFPGSRYNDSRYLAAGTFKFRKQGNAGAGYRAVRFDGVDDGLLGSANYLVGRPSTVFLVFNHLNGNEGRLLQSANGNNWLLGTHSTSDGLHASSWVAQHQVPANTPSISIAVQEVGDTRYYHNGVDLTANPNPTGVLGRVALGGGEGTHHEPGNNDLVELVIYDRVLSVGERQRVAAALAAQYGLEAGPLSPPVASPDGGSFAEARSMTLSHPVADAVIRYTTDGSEPDESSPVYAGPISISASQTIRARAYADGFSPSAVQESVFVLDTEATAAPQRQAMQLWLRADRGIELEDGKVAVWRDLSGRGMDARQANPNARPEVGAVGLAFDGTDDFVQLPQGFADWSGGLTAVFVMRPEAVGSWQRLVDLGRGSNASNLMFGRNATSTSFTFGTNAHSVTATEAFLPATTSMISVTLTPVGVAKVFFNGSLVSETSGFALPPNIIRTLNYVGRSNWTQDAYFSGSISEVVLYNSALGDLERETFETTIRARYGISSSATGTVAFSPDPAQLYPSGVDVTMASVTPGAQIRYTLDGSAPDETSLLYTGVLPLNSSARVRARAFAEGFNPSQFSEARYLVGQPPANGDGLLGHYFNSATMSGTAIVRVDPKVDFAWKTGSPDPGIGVDGFSVRWTGKVMPRFSETYQFHTFSDDGVRLWVDLNGDGEFDDATELLINDWTIRGEAERTSAAVELVAGRLYDIRLEYFDNTSTATAVLRWSSAFSEPKDVIPQSQLFSNAQFGQTVVTPVISPAGGTYPAAVEVTITTATAGSTIYYTTDGSEPDDNAQVYGGPFQVGADTVVRAKAYKAGHNPSGIAIAAYAIDALPPQITAFRWDDVEIANGRVLEAKGVLSTLATDNQGIASAEFYYLPEGSTTPILLGRDTSPGNGLSAIWDVSGIQDGAYQVRVRVFDSSGIWSETSRNVSVALAKLPAPQIVLPASGVSVQDPVVALKVQSQAGANLRIYRDDVFIFSAYANSNGVLDYLAPLPTGTSVFKAVAQNRAGASGFSNAVSVSRVREFPQLGLQFDQNTLIEGGSVIGTVTIPAATGSALNVEISTNKASQLESVGPVTIPAGATQASFTLVARQDTIIELLTTVQVTASAVEHKSRTVELFLADDDYPEIALTLERASVSEGDGSLVATLTRASATDRPLQVRLSNSKPNQVVVPEHVDIPAGKTSVVFSIGITDNAVNEGNQIAELKGEVILTGSVVAATPLVPLEIRDDEGPLLAIELAKPFAAEGATVAGKVRRSGADTAAAVTVTITQTPGGQLALPASVTIPAGQDEAVFSIEALVLPEVSGTRSITLRTSSAGFTDGFATLSVSDFGLPELAVSGVSVAGSVLSEQYVPVQYRVDNFGSAVAAGPFVERVFLSKDPSPSADDLLVRQVDMTGDVAAGGNYMRNLTVLTPRQTGLYYVIVTVDAGNAVTELDESNNSAVMATPVEIRAAYHAEVRTDAEVVPANTPVVFYGTATKEGGQPAAHSMVNIHIRLGQTTRVISAVTNSAGQFTTTWTPLRNEGGVYQIGATHPGSTGSADQDAFEILTMGFDAPASMVLNEGETAVGQAVLRNPNGRVLTGLSIRMGTLPEGLTIEPQLAGTTLAAGAEMAIPVTVTAAQGFAGSGSFTLVAETAEGVAMAAVLQVRVELLKPVLTLEPASLGASVLRGTSRTASFLISNTGGLETGAIDVLLPDLPWLTVASANPMASLAPGQSAAVSVVLAPGVDVPLTEFSGNLALKPRNGSGKAVPYRFRVVSDLKGDLEIEVQDELTFFTEAMPRLAGAKVTVRDAISSAQVASQITGESGVVRFNALNEGWYRVEVTAPEHDSFTNNYYVNAGQVVRHPVFISKQLVKYSWKVEEVEIQDVYRVKVETTFETNVPAPVVTATPSNFDVGDLVALGQTKTVNVTLENHGFIAAQESAFRFSEHPFYEFTPLVSNIGTIPAKSSLVVPVQIRRVGVFDDAGGIVTLADGERGRVTVRQFERNGNVPCSAAGAVDYNYPCGPHLVSRAVQLAINGVQGGCGGTSIPNAGREFIIELNRFYSRGRGHSGGDGGRVEASGGLLSLESLDPCTLLCLSRAALDCVVGFGPTPLACAYAAANCAASNGDALTCAGAGLCWAGPVVNSGFCIAGAVNCFLPFSGPIFGKALDERNVAVGFIMTPEIRSYAPSMAAAWENVEPALEMQALILGGKERVLMQSQPGMEDMMAALRSKANAGSDQGAVITMAEVTELQQAAAGVGLSWDLFAPIVERLNRTFEYNARGIYNPDDVPAGESLDFIPRDELQFLAQQVVEAQQASQAAGFVDPFHEFSTRADELREELTGGQGGTCAKVKIQLSQDVMMTRTAFRATLELENQRDEELTAVGFDLRVRDEDGQPAEDLFNIQITRMDGLDAADGSGEIGAKGKGTVQWTLIPRDTAALEVETRYTVGGTIHYVQSGTEFNIPVENVPITVRPDAALVLKYFHQRDVFSDDPHTDVIEPAIPYKLAVMVENQGFGEARNLKIISGQPEIVDNEKGLFVDFKIIGTEVDGQSLSPSLTADFGTVAPGQATIATWLMTSTLQGLFIDYSATFEHVSGLGDKRLSLLKEVGIHEMIRMVRDQRPGADSAPDFLVNDVADVNDYPDTIHYSDGGTDLVTLKQSGEFSGTLSPGNLSVTLNTGAFEGWSYIRLADPGNGKYRLVSVVRSDGRELPLDFNAWQTDRTFIGGGRRPRYENILHLADADSTGVYTLTYLPVAEADLLPPSSQVTAMPPLSPREIPVFWTGTDNLGVANFDIYVSIDGGPFGLWRERTTATGGIFNGTPGSAYAFYAISRDAAGNVEVKPAVAEATTEVGVSNAAPVIAAIPDQNLNEGAIFRHPVVASDPDGATSDLRFALASGPAGMVIDPVSGVIGWTTSETDGGRSVTVTVVVTDAAAEPGSASTTFQLNVLDVNDPPVISMVGPQTLQAGGILIVDLDASDGDSPAQVLTFALASGPAGAGIDPASGVVTWSPTAAQAGSHAFTIRVTDNGTPARFAETSFAVTVVSPTNRPPQFTRVPVVLWTKGKNHELTLSAIDPDGDAITLAANLSSAAGATFVDQGDGNGRLAWNPGNAASGVYRIPVTATANGSSVNAMVTIRVAEDDLYWNWVTEMFGELPDGFDLEQIGPDADPDGDGRGNVHEMAWLTNPLVKDVVKMRMTADLAPPFATIRLHTHRRKGSEAFVNLGVERGNPAEGWQEVPKADWQAVVDAEGDDDGLPHTESVDFQLIEIHPQGLPEKMFYRLKSAGKGGGGVKP